MISCAEVWSTCRQPRRSAFFGRMKVCCCRCPDAVTGATGSSVHIFGRYRKECSDPNVGCCTDVAGVPLDKIFKNVRKFSDLHENVDATDATGSAVSSFEGKKCGCC